MNVLYLKKTGGGWFRKRYDIVHNDSVIGTAESYFISLQKVEFNKTEYTFDKNGLATPDSKVCSMHSQYSIQWTGFRTRSIIRDIGSEKEFTIHGDFGSSRLDLRLDEKLVCQITYPDEFYFKAVYELGLPDHIPFCTAAMLKYSG